MGLKLFSKVKSEHEKSQLFFTLMKNAATVDIENKLVKLKLQVSGAAKEGLWLSFAQMDKTATPENINGITQTLCSVRCENKHQQYFFEAKVTHQSGRLMLAYPEDVFRLQLRHNIRHMIPPELVSRIWLLSINEKPMDLHFDLVDINIEGCQIEVPVPLPGLKRGASLHGNLELPRRKPMPFYGKVCHLSSHNGETALGVEFGNLDPVLFDHLQIFLLEIQMHLFEHRAA